jgi:methylmalonyl-CoA mutase N-terminal domain/subunit
VIYKAQIQQTGWAEGLTETETDRDTSISCYSPTPEATPEAEQMNMTDVNIYDLEEDQRSEAPTVSQRSQDQRLAEEACLKAVDDDEESPEAFAARRQASKERREKTRLKILALTPGSTESSPNNARLPAINEQVARTDDDIRPLVIREKLPTFTS